MADRYHTEGNRTFSPAFFTVHIPDVPPKLKGGGYENGMADLILCPAGLPAVEVKTGTGNHRQSFPFARWSENQRAWAKAWEEKGQGTYWLLIVCGTRAGVAPTSKTPYPRIAVLMPRVRVLELEEALGRKSIPYQLLKESEYRLEWAGNKTWHVPENHLFRQIHKETSWNLP